MDLNPTTEHYLVNEMNQMINKGDIIQTKNRFRMPYTDNKNLISSCSQVLRQQDISRKNENGGTKGAISQEAMKRQNNSRIIKINKRNLNKQAIGGGGNNGEQPNQR